MIYGKIGESSEISKDAQNRIKLLKDNMTSPMGAYTGNSKGHTTVRKAIANYINDRDGEAV